MDTAAATEPPATQEVKPPVVAHGEESVERIFRWSQFIDIGEGAGQCEHAKDGKCENPEHFHAWLRIPNSFQKRDMSDKAAAAKARKVRACRDPESDQFAILENQLDELRRVDRAILIDELVSSHMQEDLQTAVRDCGRLPEFEHIEQDQEERRRQEALPESERDQDMYDQADKAVDAFGDALRKATAELADDRRAAYETATIDTLIDEVREDRIEAMGDEQSLHTWYSWQRYLGTMKPAGYTKDQKLVIPTERAFGSIAELLRAPEEVLERLKDAFTDMELAMARGGGAKNF